MPSEFVGEIARILGLEPAQARLAVEALLESRIIPEPTDTAAEASSKDATFLLAACSSPAADVKSITAAASTVIAMDFQCDFGAEASGDRRTARTSAGTAKDCFGTQLSAVLRNICARAEDAERPDDMGREIGITIGWNREMQSMGALHLDLSDGDVSFLYADQALFADLHPAVTLTRLNFAFESRLDVPPEALRRFGRLMRDITDHPPDDGSGLDCFDFTRAMRTSMCRQGWGIHDAGNGRQTIQKVDGDSDRFQTDQEAVDHVRSMAASGSPLHKKALHRHYTEVRLEGERHVPRMQPGRQMAFDMRARVRS
ncbi:hypothetical protein [Bradyrhizobium sp.]|uniref:hypothetical protein n=1 Tax=Bradyrhizobium sp. TaxID=376 RepID=UPI002624F8CE|nr:hypothetical protein [Bradyrhizobium sp.]